ncbi:GNAT family N-acetyltransferase [Haloarchaeobius sp. HRN-SO-5]|uniref:GNAT family N-acetyltransferase n=1 Tax=Haloarchaeobius sp. HRN-SO-5 TaxID=3446118 RepID=UPI003EBAF4FD
MHVRDAVPTDAAAVLELHCAAIAERGPGGYDAEVVEAWASGRSVDDYDFDSDEFVVAETDAGGDSDDDAGGDVVGFGTATNECREHLDSTVDAEVTAVYVAPSVACQGVGTAILGDLHDRLRDRGASTAALWSSRNAVGFYERRGYERVTTHVHEFAEGVTGDVVEMRTRL